MADNRVLSAEELVSHLRQQGVGTTISFIGMVKAGEREHEIMFARGTDCTKWISLPRDLVDSAEILGSVPCAGHEHHLVRIAIKRPESEEAKVFANLAELHRVVASPRGLLNTETFTGGCFPVARETACPDRYYRTYDVSIGQEVCCPQRSQNVIAG